MCSQCVPPSRRLCRQGFRRLVCPFHPNDIASGQWLTLRFPGLKRFLADLEHILHDGDAAASVLDQDNDLVPLLEDIDEKRLAELDSAFPLSDFSVAVPFPLYLFFAFCSLDLEPAVV